AMGRRGSRGTDAERATRPPRRRWRSRGAPGCAPRPARRDDAGGARRGRLHRPSGRGQAARRSRGASRARRRDRRVDRRSARRLNARDAAAQLPTRRIASALRRIASALWRIASALRGIAATVAALRRIATTLWWIALRWLLLRWRWGRGDDPARERTE